MKLVPVLRVVAMAASGSHSTIFPQGASALALALDADSVVGAEMVTREQAEEVAARGSIHFSSESAFEAWLCEE